MNKQELALATNGFGFNVLRSLWIEGGRKETIFISPTSISTCFSLALNGADGQTREQIAATLGVPADQLDAVNTAVKELMTELETADPDAKVEIANALFGKLGYQFKQDFIDTNVANLRAEVKPLDFAGDPQGSVAQINSWCAKKTHGKITSIISQIPPSAAMFLLNAVYFKGMWANPFEKDLTEPRTFTRLDGSTVDHPTMQQFDKIPYLETDTFQAASLAYGNGRFNMYLFVPKFGTTLDGLIESLTSDNWQQWMQRFRKRDGQIYVPKFKIEYFSVLNDTLKGLGMSIAFDPDRADFSRMVPSPDSVFIDEVRHKTFIEVNEEFTEAAAVTSIGMCFATSVGSFELPFTLDVNKPFITAIRDNTTGALLFIGAIAEPK
jgi:serpin B